MSLQLPNEYSSLRGYFDVAYLASLTQGTVLHINTARAIADERFKTDPACKRVQSVCRIDDGGLILANFGPDGYVRYLWIFGTINDLPE